MDAPRVAVLGATGFVGRAVVLAVEAAGGEVTSVSAPRIESSSRTVRDLVREIGDLDRLRAQVTETLAGADAVVNAAGVASADSGETGRLVGANAVLPRLAADAALALGRQVRLVHISTAAVQGPVEQLTETAHTAPFSPYTWSKALGEAVLPEDERVIIYRPTSVHGPGRAVTHRLTRFARSTLACVAGDGDRPTPQVLVQNVGSAAAELALGRRQPPRIVLHPWEGLSTGSLLETLGGREPRHLPYRAAARLVRAGEYAGAQSTRLAANVRRVQMLWFGQHQVDGWLDSTGWRPPGGLEAWKSLAAGVQSPAAPRPG
ncbi:MAG: NAD-dependent epimerase/dehydratase family protein [Nocardioidaceae bacterium]